MASAPPPSGWVRDHLANERTLLAWVRTALAFMVFGVALAKLGWLLHLVSTDDPSLRAALPSPGRSQLVGVLLIMFGGLLTGAGVIKSRRWAKRIDPSRRPPSQRLLWVVSGLTFGVAIALVLYLLV